MPKGEFKQTPQNEVAGEIVKAYREALGLSQVEFGTHVNFAQGTISDWESGRTTVPGSLVVMAMDRLGPERVTELIQRHRAQLHVVGSQNLTGPYLPVAA